MVAFYAVTDVALRDMYILWSLDIKNQVVFYRENVNRVDVLHGMPVQDLAMWSHVQSLLCNQLWIMINK